VPAESAAETETLNHDSDLYTSWTWTFSTKYALATT